MAVTSTELPAQQTGPAGMPVSGSPVANLPKREQVSVRKRGQYVWEQYENGLRARYRHARGWAMVRQFLNGIHYFRIHADGFVQNIPKKPGDVRASVQVLKERRRTVLGFLMTNDLAVNVTPLATSTDAIHRADRGQAALTSWIEEADLLAFRSQLYSYLLDEGTVGAWRYTAPIKRNVFLRALPGSALFPIPFDASCIDEADGLIYAQVVTEQWMEQEDKLFALRMNRPPSGDEKLATEASSMALGMALNSPSLGMPGSGRFRGAVALTVWMKETPFTPGGEYMFMLNNRVKRHAIGIDPETKRPKAAEAMPGGQIPVEIGYFDKIGHDFWGFGLGEALLSSQLSVDRQMTAWERNVKFNRPLTFFDTSAINANDAQSEDASMIPMKVQNLEMSKQRPVLHFPAVQTSRDSLSLIEASRQFADSAAGMRSGILFGQQEGRTESGPATSLLAQNAMAPQVPMMDSLNRLWDRTFVSVLDMLKTVWPAEKSIRLLGADNIGREITVLRDELPASSKVIVRSRPLIPGGRNAQLSILFQLRQIPGQDGTNGTEVSSREFRAALRRLNALPEGVDLADRASARIQTRINLLTGNSQEPAIQPSQPGNAQDRLVGENHRLAVEMLKDVILDDASWASYGPNVKRALLTQLRFHMDMTYAGSGQPNRFDDDPDKFEATLMEKFMEAAEADLETDEGTATSFGG